MVKRTHVRIDSIILHVEVIEDEWDDSSAITIGNLDILAVVHSSFAEMAQFNPVKLIICPEIILDVRYDSIIDWICILNRLNFAS